jgi:hypothetical protein
VGVSLKTVTRIRCRAKMLRVSYTHRIELDMSGFYLRNNSHRIPMAWTVAAFFFFLVLNPPPALEQSAADYPQWRGVYRDGAASALVPPVKWPETSERHWKVDVAWLRHTALRRRAAICLHSPAGNEVLVCLDAHWRFHLADWLPGAVNRLLRARWSRRRRPSASPSSSGREERPSATHDIEA